MSTSRTQTPFPALIVHCWTKSRKAREPLLCWMMNRRTAKGRWVFAASVLLCHTYKILESWSWLSRWWDYTSTSYLKHSQHSQAEAWWCWHWWWLRQGEYFSLLCPQAAVSTSCSHQAHLSWENRNWMAVCPWCYQTWQGDMEQAEWSHHWGDEGLYSCSRVNFWPLLGGSFACCKAVDYNGHDLINCWLVVSLLCIISIYPCRLHIINDESTRAIQEAGN